ncbi:MAG: UDP-glucose/GDP-mannose dehydrogenase family protein [Devosia nanyangense]|uniref:UDP-glucose 6-dehydrogenase n=1 Tax=Devosia nanyangense TaxID=1228055 RepID=A0A933NY43_9HYPH|nr:UDP-glucose/GDP-mannose dehydrogenase family protein [Devosia nanyangense]
MKVTVFGIGYVGLVQAAALAEVGNEVVCVDIDPSKVEALNAGRVDIAEPDLETLVAANLREGRLVFTTDAKAGVEHGSVLFIAVGTPPAANGAADTTHVEAVARSIGQHMTSRRIVVNKSTVPVGTGEAVRRLIAEELAVRGQALPFEVVSNPEFLKEGSALADCMKPDRIILGTDGGDAERVLRQLYAPFNHNHDRFMVMDVRSAELTKYAANAMLATKISFMNEIAGIAEALGADIEQVRLGIGSDPRIGYHFIYPGIGYGGSCLPKDIRALIFAAEQTGAPPALLAAVEARNEAQKHLLFGKIVLHFGGSLSGRTFALWGLAFKPNTDDMREAPSRVIMEALWAAGAKVRAYDPKAMSACARLYGDRDDLTLTQTKEQALAGADGLIIATEWKSFRAPDLAAVAAALEVPVIFDGRNMYDPASLTEHGLTYYAIGRGQPKRGL